MKKILTIAMAATLSLSLAACGGNNNEDTTATASQTAPASATAAANTPAADATDAQNPSMEIMDLPSNISPAETEPAETEPAETALVEPPANVSIDVNAEMVAALTPEGATEISSDAGLLVLESTMAAEELKEFYSAAVQGLGATEVSSSDMEGWLYNGEYGDGKELHIVITSMGDSCSIAITY